MNAFTRFRSTSVTCLLADILTGNLQAFFYDLDGTLTGSGIREDYSRGGTVKGSSLLPRSALLPPDKCIEINDIVPPPTKYRRSRRLLGVDGPGADTANIGGMLCHDIVFRRILFKVQDPTHFIGKSLCIRPSWMPDMTRCEDRYPDCK